MVVWVVTTPEAQAEVTVVVTVGMLDEQGREFWRTKREMIAGLGRRRWGWEEGGGRGLVPGSVVLHWAHCQLHTDRCKTGSGLVEGMRKKNKEEKTRSFFFSRACSSNPADSEAIGSIYANGRHAMVGLIDATPASVYCATACAVHVVNGSPMPYTSYLRKKWAKTLRRWF